VTITQYVARKAYSRAPRPAEAEHRERTARLQEAKKLESRGALAGGVAPAINNVLSAIMLATDFLLSAHKPTDPSFQDIMQIKQNANRAASLVRQLLAISRKLTLRPQVIELSETLPDLSVLLRRLIGEKVTLKVRREATGDVKGITVEPQWIEPGEAFQAALRDSARIIEANGKRVGYVRVWSYAGNEYQALLEDVLPKRG